MSLLQMFYSKNVVLCDGVNSCLGKIRCRVDKTLSTHQSHYYKCFTPKGGGGVKICAWCKVYGVCKLKMMGI